MNNKTEQTHRYREQTSGCQEGKGSVEGRDELWDSETQTTMYKTNKQQEYTVQHKGYSQYFIITLNGIYKTLKHYFVHRKLI